MDKLQVSQLGSAWIVMLFTEIGNNRGHCVLEGRQVTSDLDVLMLSFVEIPRWQ